MKYPQILATLTEEPLLITPAAHASLMKMFQDHLEMDREEFRAAREGTDWCGEKVELEQAELMDGIYHIPIGGPIGRGLGAFEKGAGAIDVGDIENEIDTAEDEALCRSILLRIDSPGGMHSGTPELADRILACQKPIYAFSPGLMCSAAYWLGIACDGVFATKSADVGNVGTYCYLLDTSKRYEAAGVKPIVVSSGPLKGMGAPGTSFTKHQLAHLQERVDEMANSFYDFVLENRPDAKLDDFRDGQPFKAERAVNLGLIDGVVSGIDEITSIL